MDRMRRRTAHLPTLVVGALTLATAACTDGAAPADDPAAHRSEIPAMWAAEIDRYLAGDLTELERGILEDYRVTDEEYAQVREEFRLCAEEAGYEVSYGATQWEIGPGPELASQLSPDEEAARMDEVVTTCSEGTTAKVGMLYEVMQANPEGLTRLEEYRTCLEGRGATDLAALDDEALQKVLEEQVARPTATDAGACLFDPTQEMSQADLEEYVAVREADREAVESIEVAP